MAGCAQWRGFNMAMEGYNGRFIPRGAIVNQFVTCVMGCGDEQIFQPFPAVKNETRVGNFDVSKKYEIYFL